MQPHPGRHNSQVYASGRPTSRSSGGPRPCSTALGSACMARTVQKAGTPKHQQLGLQRSHGCRQCPPPNPRRQCCLTLCSCCPQGPPAPPGPLCTHQPWVHALDGEYVASEQVDGARAPFADALSRPHLSLQHVDEGPISTQQCMVACDTTSPPHTLLVRHPTALPSSVSFALSAFPRSTTPVAASIATHTHHDGPTHSLPSPPAPPTATTSS